VLYYLLTLDKLAVVILNYNGRKYLETFLPSVLLHTPFYPIYVADNGSTDDSLPYMESHFPQVKLIRLDCNYGYTGGYNRALKQVEAEIYVLLNSDVEVTPHWATPILDLFDNSPKLAACQPKLLDWKDKTRFEYAGAAGGMLDWLGYPFCRGRLFDNMEVDTGQYEDTTTVFWASGACLFVRSSLFHQVGG
jgi:GT2 family glycosyltransferase